MKEIISSQITFYFDRAALFEKICNMSALNAKYVSEEVNIDSLVLTQDEKYFFDTNIEPVVTSLVNYFVRLITSKDETYSITESEIRLAFNAAPLADGRLTQVEVDILHSLVEEWIITEILRLWYHSVAPNELLATKYAGETSSLDRRLRIVLFQFYKPQTEGSIIDCIKISGLEEDKNIFHINNRSDFVLLWKPQNLATLPPSFSISFYTTGGDIYEVSYPDESTSPKVIPVEDSEGRVIAAHIIFDLNTAGNYFQGGRLRYTMVSNIENPMFDDGLQTIETSDELPIEIWDGPSDQTLSIDATFVPAYAKLMLADLTPEEIAILQSPATKAAAEALSAAASANERSEEAREAAGHAQKQGDYAKEEGDKAQQAIIGYDAKIQEINELKQSISDAEIGREEAEMRREEAEAQRSKHWGNLSTTLNEAINSAHQNSSAARAAAEAADKARAETIKTNSDILGVEELRVLAEYTRQTNEEDRIRQENDRIGEENSRKSAETTRNQQEQIRQDNEQLRQEAEKVREKNTTDAISAINGKISEANTAIGSIEQKISEADKAIKETDEATAKANKAAEEADAAREGIAEALGRKADIDKTYPKMTVGFAQEIVGDGSATPEEFSFRPTAGEDRNVANTTYYEGERNGVARIEKVKGNSVVWNKQGGIEGGEVIGPDGRALFDFKQTLFIAGNKYLAISHLIDEAGEYPNARLDIYTRVDGTNTRIHYWYLTTKNYSFFESPYSALAAATMQESWEGKAWLSVMYAAKIDKCDIYDLTKMFGAGNEPTTIEEFWQRLPKGADINAYNEGEIVNGNYGALKTTGFNQWDEQWELGGIATATGEVFGSDTRIRSKNYNPALPNTSYVLSMPTGQPILIFWYDSNYQFISYNYSSDQSAYKISPSNARYFKILLYDTYGTTYKNDICINIAWDEYAFMNGMYQPYKPFERDLSWIGRIKDSNGNLVFPNGMRSAGSVRDEIRFNSTTQKWEAVQNVGVRAYAEGDTEDTSVTTDGTNTNYALGTPIITEITEDINMDFDVSDYGTEELIVAEGAQSAPLVADITYAPNALSTIKQVPDILKRLKALESAISQQTTNIEE